MTTRFYGEIALFPFRQPPAGWLPCDGRLLNLNHHSALFSLLGNRFGGSLRQQTFGIPKLEPLTVDAYSGAELRFYIGVAAFGGRSGDFYFPDGSFRNRPIGSIVLTAMALRDESNALRCDGRLVPTTENPALAAAVGDTKGAGSVVLPDLRAFAPESYVVAADQGPVRESELIGTVEISLARTILPDRVPCDGRLLKIEQDRVLYSLLGSTFGGDGQRTFALPDARTLPLPAGVQVRMITKGMYPNLMAGPFGLDAGAAEGIADEAQ